MNRRMRAMRYYISNGEGLATIGKLTAAFTAAAVAVTCLLIAVNAPVSLVLLLTGWLWPMALWSMKHLIIESFRSYRLARTAGRGPEAALLLMDFEAAAPLCGDRLRVGRQFVFARKGGVVSCAAIRRAYLGRQSTKDSAYVAYLAEDERGTQHILARWQEEQFREAYAWEISRALAERCRHITFE